MDTAAWRVEVLPAADAELAELPDRVKDAAVQIIVDLEEDPFPQGSKELRGHVGLYSVRCYRDQYRLIYRVSEKQRLVIVARVRQRAAAYEGL